MRETTDSRTLDALAENLRKPLSGTAVGKPFLHLLGCIHECVDSGCALDIGHHSPDCTKDPRRAVERCPYDELPDLSR